MIFMEGQGSSFIPKSSARVPSRTRVTHRIYVLSYISYIVFFGALFAVAGVYLYGSNVARSLEALKSQLVTERSRFNNEDIEAIKLLDKRLSTAEQFVEESSAPSRIFGDIEDVVASNIQFSGFKYRYLSNRQFEIALTGRAEELNEIVWQRELLKNTNILRDAVVSKYDYSVDGESSVTTVSGDATLTFVISDTRSTALIPYLPPALPASTTTDEIIIDTATSSDES